MFYRLRSFWRTGSFTPIYDPWVDSVLRIRLLESRQKLFGRDRFHDRVHYTRYTTWWWFGCPVWQTIEGQSRLDPYDFGEVKPSLLKLFVSPKE